MADVHSKKTRSFNMSQIRSVNTKPEIKLRKFLFKNGLRYRLHVKSLPGKPDVVFSTHKIAVFVHGCFWHAHENCQYFVIPKTKSAWWRNKLLSNRDRDKKIILNLKKQGWNVVVVWECEINNNFEKTARKVLKILETKKTQPRLL